MSNTHSKIGRTAGLLAVLACSLAVLAAPAPAAAEANWSIFGSLMDSDDLAEAFGGGLRVGVPFNETWQFDVSVAYYEDFKNRWENDTEDRISVELSFIPADFGVTWTKNGDSGFQFGLGLTWAYLDINDLEIENFETNITGDADNEFGGYLKLGYQAQGGFFGELMYRLLDASVENLTIAGIDTGPGSNELKMGGATINLGYRIQASAGDP